MRKANDARNLPNDCAKNATSHEHCSRNLRRTDLGAFRAGSISTQRRARRRSGCAISVAPTDAMRRPHFGTFASEINGRTSDPPTDDAPSSLPREGSKTSRCRRFATTQSYSCDRAQIASSKAPPPTNPARESASCIHPPMRRIRTFVPRGFPIPQTPPSMRHPGDSARHVFH